MAINPRCGCGRCLGQQYQSFSRLEGLSQCHAISLGPFGTALVLDELFLVHLVLLILLPMPDFLGSFVGFHSR